MARIYSKSRGKAGSKKPLQFKARWCTYKPKEIEMLIVKLAKSELSASQIGLTLRDTYGIPDVKKLTGKTITKILEEKEIKKKLPEDLSFLIKRLIALQKHLVNNHKDEVARRGITITASKINRLIKYYKNSKVLPQDFKFDRTKAEMFIE
ncbi:30S ribosomal protein S15 [Candidatus Woesearchaeota archaeon]|nr:30S ribosomal protein S15 [Candidatus Woesearchaeota archaeon]MBW3016846.1 30S ribosomal protein S15 [Candidatus Woesearchaeota archaeon]